MYGFNFSLGHFNQHTSVRGEIEIGDEYTGGYWETYGYNWFSGL